MSLHGGNEIQFKMAEHQFDAHHKFDELHPNTKPRQQLKKWMQEVSSPDNSKLMGL